ncbi:MAG: pitrilysin family protein [Patescibacteria group bacterium]
MKIQKDVLSNGLRLISASVPGVESCTVQVFVGAGSRHETKNTHGLAHFLEHMVFKGTSRYPSAHAVSSAADSIGAEINASTSKERTSFYLKSGKDHIKLAFDLLSDMVWNPIVDHKEIEREKGVIVSEIQMYEDLPPQRAYSAFEELVFLGSDLEHDVAGKRGTVTKLTKSEFSEFRERFYRPERMVVAVAGKFDLAEVKGLTQEYFNGGGLAVESTALVVLPRAFSHENPQGAPSREPLLRASPLGLDRVKLITKKTEQAHIFLGFPASPLGSKDRYIEAVLAAILGGGMSSRLFTEVRERRGLAYYINSVHQDYTDAGYLGVRMGVNLKKVEEAIRVVMGEFVQFDKLEQSELEKAKEYTKGKFILSLEDTETVSDFVGEDELLEGRGRSVEEVVGGVNRVGVEDLVRVAGRLFEPGKLRMVVVGPYSESKRFQDILEL